MSGVTTSVILVAAFGSRHVPTPTLLQGMLLSVPLSVYLPLATVITVVFCLSNTPVEIEATEVRRANHYDAGAVLAIAGLAAITCVAASGVWGGDAPLQGARNIVGYLGLGVLALSLVGSQASSFVPTAFAVLAAMFGWTPARTARWWAWPLAPADDTGAIAWAAVTLAIGTGVLVARGRGGS